MSQRIVSNHEDLGKVTIAVPKCRGINDKAVSFATESLPAIVKQLITVARAEECQRESLHGLVRQLCATVRRQDWEAAMTQAANVSAMLPPSTSMAVPAENCRDSIASAFLEP